MDINRFEELKNSNVGKASYDVLSYDNMDHKLGKSKEGYPMVFIKTIPDSLFHVPNLVRKILSVEYNILCSVVSEKDTQEGIFSIITLHSENRSLQSYFIDIISLMLERMPLIPSIKELSIEVERLISIFTALNRPPIKKIQGLWAELFLIERSSNPELLINAWHNQPASKYDFTLGKDKIEVKSTSSENRKHKFSLDQLNPSENSRLLVVSNIIRESGPSQDGLSVYDLYNKISHRIVNTELKLKLCTVITNTIGKEFEKTMNLYFDYASAIDCEKFYNYIQIPRIDQKDIHPMISEVRFSVNLDGIESIDKESVYKVFGDSSLYKSL